MTRIEDSFCLESLSRVDLKCNKNIKSTINGSTAEGSYLKKIDKSQENLSTSQHDDDITNHSNRHASERYDVCITCYKPLSKHPAVYNRIHSWERTSCCDAQAKALSKQVTESKHSRAYNGEKGYPCSKCSKSYYVPCIIS